MKKSSILVACGTALIILLAGCSGGGGGGFEAPVMPAPSTLPDLNPTLPADDAEAIALYNEAQLAMQATAPVEEPVDSAASLPARATQDIYHQETCGAGTITYTGTVSENTSGSMTRSTTVQTYIVNGVVDNATVYVNGVSGTYYTVNGTTSDKSKTTMTTSIIGSGSDMTFKLDFAINMASGAALSFKRSTDGKGGKFIVSYATDFNGSFDLESMFAAMDPDAYEDYFAESAVTMYVYNDEDVLVRTINTTLDQLTVTALPEDDGIEID